MSDILRLRVPAVAEGRDTYFDRALSDTSRKRSAKFAQVCINGVSLTAKIDYGAEVTAVPASFTGIPRQLQTAHEIMKGPSDQILHVIGKFMAEITCKEKRSQHCVCVIDPCTRRYWDYQDWNRWALLGDVKSSFYISSVV